MDQTFGYPFVKDGRLVRAVDVYGDPELRAHFAPIYKALNHKVVEDLGDTLKNAMVQGDNPLDGFKDIGIHNHFVL